MFEEWPIRLRFLHCDVRRELMTPSIAAVSHRVGRSATRWWRSIVPLMLTIVVAASGTTAAASDREEALAASPQILVVFSDDPS